MNKLLQFSTLIVFQLLIGACQHLSSDSNPQPTVQVEHEWAPEMRMPAQSIVEDTLRNHQLQLEKPEIAARSLELLKKIDGIWTTSCVSYYATSSKREITFTEQSMSLLLYI